MGYYTYYSMKVRNISKEEYEKLNTVLENRDLINYVFSRGSYDEKYQEAEYPCWEDQKWYDNDKDMESISKTFPLCVFELSGEGEEQGDFWKCYFKNGDSELCHGEVVYEKPSRIEWDDLIKF